MKIFDFVTNILKHWRAIALTLIGLLLVYGYNNSLIKAAELSILNQIKPLMSITSLMTDYFQQTGKALTNFIGLRAKYQSLQLENQLLKDNILMLQQLYYENEELRRFNKLKLPQATRIATTRIINQYDGAYISNALILAGKEQQIKTGQIAVNGDGVVGQVIDAGPQISRILLLIDPSSKIPVFFPRTKERAIAVGNHTNLLSNYLAQSTQITTNDLVITSGDGVIFPYGLPIGMVSAVIGKNITITPFYNKNKLDLVTILSY